MPSVGTRRKTKGEVGGGPLPSDRGEKRKKKINSIPCCFPFSIFKLSQMNNLQCEMNTEFNGTQMPIQYIVIISNQIGLLSYE